MLFFVNMICLFFGFPAEASLLGQYVAFLSEFWYNGHTRLRHFLSLSVIFNWGIDKSISCCISSC